MFLELQISISECDNETEVMAAGNAALQEYSMLIFYCIIDPINAVLVRLQKHISHSLLIHLIGAVETK